MSGDVQPRKRRDKRKKKDELCVEEPKGTAAALAEGDVFMHSYQEHGTGGHWCAKIVFFSLLAILVTLIGLIILENRGLTDLEASTVQTQYSGVLDGWLEEAPDDDHDDAHTLELNHHDDEIEQSRYVYGNEGDDDKQNSEENDEDDEQNSEEQDDDDEENDEDQDDDDDDNSAAQDHDEQDDDDENSVEQHDNDDDKDYNTNNEDNYENDHYNNDNDDDNDYNSKEDKHYDDNNLSEDENDDQQSEEYLKHENEEEHDDEDDHDDEEEEVELEHIEHEPEDVEPISIELPALPEENDSDEQNDDDDDDDNKADDDDEYLEQDDNNDDFEPLVVERVSAPAGKPYYEMEDSTEELPVDTLAEEDEYEKQQEELRREQAETTHMWLKLVVGAALLAATQAVVRRASRGDNSETAEEVEDEEPEAEPEVVDRRMTIISQEESSSTALKAQEAKKEVSKEVKRTPILIQTTKPTLDEDEDEDEEIEEEIIQPIITKKVEIKTQAKPLKEPTPEKELYSDEEDEEDEDLPVLIPDKEDVEIEEVDDDVEIIDEELEEDDDEEISDVDDAELLSRLEAKYGRLPDNQRTDQIHKDGGNSVEDFWAEEPNDPYWRQQLDEAEHLMHQGLLTAAVELVSAASLKSSARGRWILAQALERLAEQRRDNGLLNRCIAAYFELLKINDRLSDKQLLAATNRTIDRINFQGNYLRTVPVYRLLIRRFPDQPAYRNNLTIAFLTANRADLAVIVLNETLKLWPEDRIALAHYGFVLKTLYNKLEESIVYFQKALEGDQGEAVEPRFYYHLGDALLLLGRFDEAHNVHKRGADLGMFLSPSQRSLYNVDHLKSKPWWNVQETPYKRLAESLEKSWKDILKEGEAVSNLYEKEREGLKEKGEWSQLDLFRRGREVPGMCAKSPITCRVLRLEKSAIGCRRGQIKFSLMAPGTHVRPHVGPTNCRLRMHLGLSNTDDTFLRVDKETRQWQVGKVLMFDDSFEHEVWHNGTAPRLVLIVDVWHPSLTATERQTLPAI